MKNGIKAIPLWLLVATVLLGTSLSAQQVSTRRADDLIDSVNGATEDDLIAKALQSNSWLTADKQQVSIASAEVSQAQLRKNPSVMIGGMREIIGQDSRFNVSGALPLELFGRRAKRTDVAERRLALSRNELEERKRLVIGEVRTLFAEALAAVRNLRVAEDFLETNRKFLQSMEDRAREGAAAPLEAAEIRVEVNRLEVMRIEYQTKVEIAYHKLQEVAGAEPAEGLRLKGNLEQERITFDQEQLLKQALAKRPDLAAQYARGAVASADLNLQKADGKLDAAITAGYERPNSGFELQGVDPMGSLRPIRQSFNYAVFGIELEVPVFNRNRGAIAAATAEQEAARNRTAAAVLSLRHEIARNLIEYESSHARRALYRASVLDQAEKNLVVVRAAFDAGRTSLLDVLTEQRRYLELETDFTGILYDAYTARISLDQASAANLQ